MPPNISINSLYHIMSKLCRLHCGTSILIQEIFMPIQQVIIVRHGETDYNAQHRWQGQLDVPLNKNGKAQAEALAKHLANEALDGVFSSDLKRCYDTARPIAKSKNLTVIPDKRLREVHLGLFQGLTRTQIQEVYPQKMMRWDNDDSYVITHGESRSQVQNRTFEAWLEIIKREDMSNIMIVSHGGAIRMMLTKVLPQTTERLRFANTSFSILERDSNNTWQVKSINMTSHLE